MLHQPVVLYGVSIASEDVWVWYLFESRLLVFGWFLYIFYNMMLLFIVESIPLRIPIKKTNIPLSIDKEHLPLP